MFIDIGYDIALATKTVVAIIGYTQKGSESNKCNDNFLSAMKQGGEIIDISGGKVKSIILADSNRVYLSSLSKKTLLKRYLSNGLTGGEK